MEDQNSMGIIAQLMEELQGLMGPKEEDFESRLGREKPKVEVMSIDTGGDEDSFGDGMEGDMMESPEDKLKSRLMKLRG